MELGVHLPVIDFGDGPVTGAQLARYARRAADLGFTTLAANDHLVFPAPWLDGLTALASVIGESGGMRLATTVALPVVRGPVTFAKAMATIDRLSGGRVVAGVGPGSAAGDHEAVGLAFEERWARLEEAVLALRALWGPADEPYAGRFYSTEGIRLAPEPAQPGGPPIWIGSWGSPAGLRRVARLADGWLASAYNTTPGDFGRAWDDLRSMLSERGREPVGYPNALATMWFHITDDAGEADDVLRRRLLPVVHRPEDVLRERLPIGPAGAFVEKLLAFREAGVDQVLVWPVADGERQLERLREHVWPHVAAP